MTKLTVLLCRNPALSHEEFVEYHRSSHGPLFTSLPVVQENVRRYVQQHPLADQLPGVPSADIDGFTELWFDDIDAIATVFLSPSYLEVIRPDEAKFLDLLGCEFIVTDEHQVHP